MVHEYDYLIVSAVYNTPVLFIAKHSFACVLVCFLYNLHLSSGVKVVTLVNLTSLLLTLVRERVQTVELLLHHLVGNTDCL